MAASSNHCPSFWAPAPQSPEPQGYLRAFPYPQKGLFAENLVGSYNEISYALSNTQHRNDLNSLNYWTIEEIYNVCWLEKKGKLLWKNLNFDLKVKG